MSKQTHVNRLPLEYDKARFIDIIRPLESQLNALAEGRIAARYQAQTSYPTGTSQSYQKGDLVWNISPAETGVTAGMYVVLGWICTTAGSPGTWKELRCLTGS